MTSFRARVWLDLHADPCRMRRGIHSEGRGGGEGVACAYQTCASLPASIEFSIKLVCVCILAVSRPACLSRSDSSFGTARHMWRAPSGRHLPLSQLTVANADPAQAPATYRRQEGPSLRVRLYSNYDFNPAPAKLHALRDNANAWKGDGESGRVGHST